MRAIQITEPGVLAIIETVKPEQVAEGHVLIQVKAMGICGSDMHAYHGTSPLVTYPRIIGHEVVGEVAEVGAGVTGLQKGDRVVMDPVISCGECYACRVSRQNVCRNLRVRGVHAEGGFMEYLMLPVWSVHKFSKDIPWEEAVLIEPFTIAAQALSRGRVTSDDTLVIFGAGPIGLVTMQRAKSLGARVAIIDIVDERLKFAKDLGADLVINPQQEDVMQKVASFTEGEGPSVIVEAVGIPRLLEQAVEMASPAGRIVNLGFSSQPSQIAELPITKKELDIIGSRLHNNKFPEVIGWFEKKEVNPKPLVTHVFDFHLIHEAIALMEAKPQETCKVILRLQ